MGRRQQPKQKRALQLTGPRRRKKRCEKTGKVRYPDKLEAMIQASHAQSQGRDGGRAHFCRSCGDWHLWPRDRRRRM